MPFNPPRGLKRELLAGEPKIGMFLGTSSVQVAELVAFQDIDFLFVDLEHGERNDVLSVAEIIRAADAAGKPVIVRVPTNSVEAIGYVLDHGAVGICVPHVRTREDAERAVSYARYAPEGERAMSPLVRATQYSGEDWEDVWRTANDEMIVMALIEDAKGLENLEEIASVPGIDVIWIGVGDLSQDLGFPGQLDHPKIVEAVERGLAAAKENRKIAYTPLGGLDPGRDFHSEVEAAMAAGFRMLAWVDIVLIGAVIRDAVRSVANLRGEH